MASQNVLLDALKAYEGTLLVVSHDRYFLDRLVDRVLEIDSGALRDWPGNLSEYLERKGFGQDGGAAKASAADRVPVEARSETAPKSREQKRLEAEIRNRMSSAMRAARTEVETLQKQIDAREARKKQIEALLANEELYRDADKCRVLDVRISADPQRTVGPVGGLGTGGARARGT